MLNGINIFSEYIRVYEYALNQIPYRKNALETLYITNNIFEHILIVIKK